MIKAISFDLWNTLIFSNPEYRKCRNSKILELCKKTNNLNFNTEEEVETIFRMLKRDIDGSVEKFGIQYEINDVYNILSNQFNIKSDTLRIVCEEAFLSNLPILREGVKETLKKLKQKHYKMCISSNTVLISGNVLYRALHKLGIDKYFDFFLFSDQLGISKPNYMFFVKIQTSFSEFKHHILHVGDNVETDCRGSIAYEIKSMHISKTDDFNEVISRAEFFK